MRWLNANYHGKGTENSTARDAVWAVPWLTDSSATYDIFIWWIPVRKQRHNPRGNSPFRPLCDKTHLPGLQHDTRRHACNEFSAAARRVEQESQYNLLTKVGEALRSRR